MAREIITFQCTECKDRNYTNMKNKKTTNPKKNGTLRPWLVDVVVDSVR